MGVPMTRLEIRKEVRLETSEMERYLKALDEEGVPALIGSEPNESLKIILELRRKYSMLAVERVQITNEGIFRYVL